MPTGHEFTAQEKLLIFKVIRFCEQEKTGPIIPLYNVVERIAKMLDISETSVKRLKKEMNELIQQQQTELEEEQNRKQQEERELAENKRQLRSQTKLDSASQDRSTFSKPKRLHRRQSHTGSLAAAKNHSSIPRPYSPQKKGKRCLIVRININENINFLFR
ncbi:unnamed protein product [Rotaria sp. Silwood2]|nr:unnamed protein product [Rotaria sp. Silwood2]